MKKLKALLAVLTLSCLLAAAARADGTMTTGGGAPPPPPPPRTTVYAEEVDPDPAVADAPANTAPEVAPSTLEALREAMLQIACWIIW